MKYQSLNCCIASSFPEEELLPEILKTGQEIPASASLRFSHLTSSYIHYSIIYWINPHASFHQTLESFNKDLKKNPLMWNNLNVPSTPNILQELKLIESHCKLLPGFSILRQPMATRTQVTCHVSWQMSCYGQKGKAFRYYSVEISPT